jgi:hypothetical protein
MAQSSPLRDLVREGSFGPFFADDLEFLRRMFVTVRDRSWREIGPSRWTYAVNEDHATIEVSARHTSELIDFSWQGRLEIDRAGRALSFEFEGQALRTMEVCRLGLVLLHPVPMLTGATLTTRGGAGVKSTIVPRQIAPQPVVNGTPGALTEPFTSLTIEHAGLGRLSLEFHGDLFELEDQRNWGDASFKTYCTPLRMGFPRTIEQGTRIAHRVDAQFTPAAHAQDRGRGEDRTWDPGGLRATGLRMGRLAPAAQRDSSWMLGWEHIRVDLDETEDSDFEELLTQLPRGTTLHLVHAVAEECPLSRSRVALLNSHSARISAIILRDRERPLPTAQAVAQVRAALRDSLGARIPLLASPNGHFVEFNRGRPFNLDVDGIAFPLSPTVHAQDAQTILENACAVRDMVTTAREVTGKSRISLSPVALCLTPAGKPLEVGRAVATAWMAAVLAQAAETGVASVTLASDLL